MDTVTERIDSLPFQVTAAMERADAYTSLVQSEFLNDRPRSI